MSVVLYEGRYTWHVKAFDDAGNTSDWSAIDSFGVDLTPPVIDSVTILPDTAFFFGPYEVSAWVRDSLSGVRSVWLHYSIDEGVFDSTGMVQNGVWQGSIPSLGDSTSHEIRYYVSVYDNAEPSNVAVSDTMEFSVTEVNEGSVIVRNEVKGIYPNPAISGKASVIFELREMTNVAVRVYDVSGREIWKCSRKMRAGRGELPIGMRLGSGIYFVEVRVKGLRKKIFKVIVERR